MDPLNVAGHPRNKLSRRIEMKEAKWLEKDLLECVVPQIPHNGLPEVRHDIDRPVLRDRFNGRDDNKESEKDPSI